MAKKEKFDPNLLSSQGLWIDKATRDLKRRAGPDTFQALELGLLPEQLSLLQQLEAEALGFKADIREINLAIQSQPDGPLVESLLKRKSALTLRHSTTKADKADDEAALSKINDRLRQSPNRRGIAKLMDQRALFQRAFDERRIEAQKIYPKLNPDWPPLKPAKKKT